MINFYLLTCIDKKLKFKNPEKIQTIKQCGFKNIKSDNQAYSIAGKWYEKRYRNYLLSFLKDY